MIIPLTKTQYLNVSQMYYLLPFLPYSYSGSTNKHSSLFWFRTKIQAPYTV